MTSQAPSQARRPRAPAALLIAALALAPALGASPAPDESRSLPAWALPNDALLRSRGDHLALLGAADWQSHGVRGRGIKVAVLDSGFRGYREQLGKALPAAVTVRTFR